MVTLDLAVKFGEGTERNLVIVEEQKLMESLRPRVYPNKCTLSTDRVAIIPSKT